MAKGQEMVVKKEEELSIAAPIVGVAAKGFENFKQEDMILPRLRLLQPTSDAVNAGTGKLGQFQNSLTEEVIGDSVEVVLLGMKNGAVYFEQKEGLICSSPDGIVSRDGNKCSECPYGCYYGSKWAKGEKPPKCSASKEFICVTRNTLRGVENMPIVVSFIKTSYGVGKKLASMAKISGRDIYAGAYIIGSDITKNDSGTFAVLKVKQNGWLSKEEYEMAARWYEDIAASKVTVVDSMEDLKVEEDGYGDIEL